MLPTISFPTIQRLTIGGRLSFGAIIWCFISVLLVGWSEGWLFSCLGSLGILGILCSSVTPSSFSCMLGQWCSRGNSSQKKNQTQNPNNPTPESQTIPQPFAWGRPEQCVKPCTCKCAVLGARCFLLCTEYLSYVTSSLVRMVWLLD